MSKIRVQHSKGQMKLKKKKNLPKHGGVYLIIHYVICALICVSKMLLDLSCLTLQENVVLSFFTVFTAEFTFMKTKQQPSQDKLPVFSSQCPISLASLYISQDMTSSVARVIHHGWQEMSGCQFQKYGKCCF